MVSWFWYLRSIGALALFGLVVDLITFGISRTYHIPLTFGIPLTIFLPMVVALNPAINPTLDYHNPKLKEPSEELTKLAESYLSQLGIPAVPVNILHGRYAQKVVNGLARHKEILITERAFQELTDEEIKFVVAHEVAHLKWKDNVSRVNRPIHPFVRNSIVSLVVLTMAGFMVALRLETGWVPKGAAVAGFCLTLLGAHAVTPRNSAPPKQIELWCDATAVELTNDPTAAIFALKKLDHPKTKVDKALANHPDLVTRLKNLESKLNPQ